VVEADSVTYRTGSGSLTEFHDRPCDLMARNQRKVGNRAGPGSIVHVGSTDAGGFDAYDDFARGSREVREFDRGEWSLCCCDLERVHRPRAYGIHRPGRWLS